MIEFLFCPIHGVFRPANIQLMLAYTGGVWMEAELLYIRLVAFFGRFV